MEAHLRALAGNDIDTAIAYYKQEAGPQVAVEFVDALEDAIDHLRKHPLTGSLRFAYELEIPGLRSWPLQTFPHLVFYVPDEERIDIWRVLHASRDIPTHLASDRAE